MRRTSKMRLHFTANCFIFGRKNRVYAPRTFSAKLAGKELKNPFELHWKLLGFRTHKSWKCAMNFLYTSQSENFQNASECHGKQLHFWTQKSWICAQNLFCKTCRQRISKMRLNSKANSFVFRRKSRDLTSQGENFRNASELRRKQLHFWTHISWKCAQKFFCEPCKRRTFKMRLNLMANSFVFGRKNRDNAPRTFFINLIRRKLPKCVWNQQQTASFLDAKIEMMRHELFYKACTEKTSKFCLNFTANSFIFARKNRENAPITFFIKLAWRKLPKSVWTSS